MIAMSGEQMVVFAIVAAAGYWVVSLVLNKMFPSRGSEEPAGPPPFEQNDPEQSRRSAEMRDAFPPPPPSLDPPGLRDGPRRCSDPQCGELNPPNARFCSRCGRPTRG